ncbi:MAG: adenylosuccinate lyase [bacterium]|nr:adenylosuccinate lyase [bacterium]
MTDLYVSPFSTRYTSTEMKRLFSDDWKFSTWRKVWLEIARGQKNLGVKRITAAQIEEMSAHLSDIDYALAAKFEKEGRHDVVAHSQTFGEACPLAAPIIHLGLTSCDVTDNAELIQVREGLKMLLAKLAKGISRLAAFAKKHKDTPTLGFTHLQPAQPITIGKRACMWLQDLFVHLLEIEDVLENLKFRGIKGATGTQAAMVQVFEGKVENVSLLEKAVAETFGFGNKIWPITGQTYPRLVDTKVMQTLASLAASVHKICLDIRQLQHLKEIEEPFERNQKGSSAMAYKRNPARTERGCAIARHIMTLPAEALMTQALQGFERTLDDSAGRRIYIAESYLATDAILIISQNVFEGMVVYPQMIERHLQAELPFMATEEIITAMVEAGADRREVYERLRVLSQEAGYRVKGLGENNPFIQMVRNEELFAPVKDRLDSLLDPRRFIGQSSEQVSAFLESEVLPILSRYPDAEEGVAELKV